MAALSSTFVYELQQLIGDLSQYHAQQRRVHVTDEARAFLADVITESLIFRADEWNRQLSIDVSNAQRLLESTKYLKEVLGVLFNQAEPMKANDREFLGVISFVEAIHFKWCGVFPFCRRR